MTDTTTTSRPTVELVTIGTELLLGDTIDTNSAEIARLLSRHGIRVSRRTTVADRKDHIAEVVGGALDRAHLVIVTGGLGPTRDDITRDTVAELVDAPLALDDRLWEALQERWRSRGRPIDPANRSQAMVPRGATVLPNHRGSAPGLWIDSERGLVVLLPGVPSEAVALMEEEVLPRLSERLGALVISSRVFRTSGIAEARLGSLLGPLEDSMQPATLAYLPDQIGVDLRLTVWDADPETVAATLDAAESIVRSAAGEWIYGTGHTDLAEVLLERLRERELTLAVAESCTGGMVGERLTAIPGSSDVFLGGVTSYANSVKIGQLGVPRDLLERDGAVSEAVARSMVRGVAELLGADAAIAVTGIAGPGGATPDKPVGTVWLSWTLGGEVSARLSTFSGDRDQVRERATQAALLGLFRLLDSI